MELQSQLSQIIHPSRVLTSHLYRTAYANDASYFRLIPQAVVQPESINEIQSIYSHDFSLVWDKSFTSGCDGWNSD